MGGIAFIFPGQGSQMVGMGKALGDQFQTARAVFSEIDAALEQNLSRLMWEGPLPELTLTENAQPAIMAVSLAMMRVLEQDFGIRLEQYGCFAAGHSLGEYSALAAAGFFSLADTARLLRIRGRAMQEAVPVGAGAMAAILGLDHKILCMIAKQAADKVSEQDAATQIICEIANDNSDGQIVLSGHDKAIEQAMLIAKEYGAKRVVRLPVSAPFHCSLMQPAQLKMQAALENVVTHQASLPIIANISARPMMERTEICQNLIRQIIGMVRWRESIGYMVEQGVDLFIEVGTGRVLTGLLKKNAPLARGISLSEPQDIAVAISVLEREGGSDV